MRLSVRYPYAERGDLCAESCISQVVQLDEEIDRDALADVHAKLKARHQNGTLPNGKTT